MIGQVTGPAWTLQAIGTESHRADSIGLAREFESLLLSQLMKDMRQSGFDESGMFPGDESDTLGSMFDLHMGRQLAMQGGFGLAKSLEPYLARIADAPAVDDPAVKGGETP
ncbi:MAG: rod-binding protein [Planctomycetaceae bacterium]